MDWKKIAAAVVNDPTVRDAAGRLVKKGLERAAGPASTPTEGADATNAPPKKTLRETLAETAAEVAKDWLGEQLKKRVPDLEDDAITAWVNAVRQRTLLVPFDAITAAIKATSADDVDSVSLRREGGRIVIDGKTRRAGGDLRVEARVEPRGVVFGERIEIGFHLVDATLSGEGVYDRIVAAVAAGVCQVAWGGVPSAVERALVTSCSIRKDGDALWIDVTSAPAPARVLALVKRASGRSLDFGALMTCSKCEVADEGVLLTLEPGPLGAVILERASKLLGAVRPGPT